MAEVQYNGRDSNFKQLCCNASKKKILPGINFCTQSCFKFYNEINQIGVPESALTIQGDTAFVYIVNNNVAKKKNVKIGKRNFGKVSILSGVSEGDLTRIC